MPENRFKMLIIEDDAVLGRALARLFSDTGYEVLQIGNGAQALDAIARQQPDLILCDYRLPQVDGLEILCHLKNQDQHFLFILMTAYFSEKLEEKALALGALTVLEKPLEIVQLKRYCEQALGRKDAPSPQKPERQSENAGRSKSKICK